MPTVKLDLPWPPSVNHYKTVGAIVRTKNGKTYQKRVNSKETIAYYWEVKALVIELNQAEAFKFKQHAKIPVSACLSIHPPDNRRRDLDNLLKVLLDSLVHGGLIHDDSQIHRLFVQKLGIIPEGKVVVQLSALDGD